jgi:hypothetical protein
MSVVSYIEHITRKLKVHQETIATKLCTGQGVDTYADYKELVGRYKQVSSDILTHKEALQEAENEV